MIVVCLIILIPVVGSMNPIEELGFARPISVNTRFFERVQKVASSI